MSKPTDTIIDLFREINKIPRCSKKEEKISGWLRQWAEDKGFPVKSDAAGNLNIRVPASPGCEDRPGIVVQGHMDMVCEKHADSDHDFSKDPIPVIADGDWLRADGTTLGADNGIALALAMVLATDRGVTRPPLELLFTVDEETGLTGALQMEEGFVDGRILINIDSEDEGVFTVGCAGGIDSRISLPLESVPIGDTAAVFTLAAKGMRGGHSGIDIDKHRANAIKVLTRGLDRLSGVCDLRLLSLDGGRSKNAIPREAKAMFAAGPDEVDGFKVQIDDIAEAIRAEYARTEPSLTLTLSRGEIPSPRTGLSPEITRRVICLLLALPDGVDDMSEEMVGLVQTSSNLARVHLEAEKLSIISSQRSSVMSRLFEITRRVESIVVLAGGQADRVNAYPSWQPNLASPLLRRCRETYLGLFGAEPKVEAIHAGLECGVIGSKSPGMDMISIGPTLRNPHSPDEKLHVPSVEKVWEFLAALVESYAQPEERP